jgi:hypothetical protein
MLLLLGTYGSPPVVLRVYYTEVNNYEPFIYFDRWFIITYYLLYRR